MMGQLDLSSMIYQKDKKNLLSAHEGTKDKRYTPH